MGIILSAMTGAGNAGVESMNQNIAQQNALDSDSRRSALETLKQKAIIDYQKSAALDAQNQARQGQMDRIGAATTAIVQPQIDAKYASSDAAVAAAAAGQTGSQLTPEQQAVIDQAKKADYAKLAADPHSYIQAAMASGDIDPHQVAQLVQQEDALRRSEAAQVAQFSHSDASQAAAQRFQAMQQANTQAFQAGENQKTRNAMDQRVQMKLNANMPPSDLTDEEKKNWVHTYLTSNGSVPRSAPTYVKNSIGTWAAQMGITPEDISKGTAQMKYDQSAAATSGHRSGSMAVVEAAMPAISQNALELSAAIPKGDFVPLNKLMTMSEDAISDPRVAAFKVGHQALASEYQMVIGRGGTNVFALKEAMHVLEAARSQEAYAAAVQQVQKEVAMNVAATSAVRANIGGAHPPVTAPTTFGKPVTAPNPVAPTGKPSLNDIFGQ